MPLKISMWLGILFVISNYTSRGIGQMVLDQTFRNLLMKTLDWEEASVQSPSVVSDHKELYNMLIYTV